MESAKAEKKAGPWSALAHFRNIQKRVGIDMEADLKF